MLLPHAAARQPSKASSMAASNSLLPPTECSLGSGCLVAECHPVCESRHSTTAAQCAGGWGLGGPPFRALASDSTAQPRQSPPVLTGSYQPPHFCQRCCKTLSLGTIAACACRCLSTAFSQSPGARRASGDWPGLGRCRWTWRFADRYPKRATSSKA